MNRHVFIAPFLFISASILAQLNLHWQKTFGSPDYEFGNAVCNTQDGGWAIASFELHNINQSGDAGVYRLDANHNLLWYKLYGGSDIDQPLSIQQTSDGGFVLTGFSNSANGGIPNNYGKEDAWVVKIDPMGNIEWQKNFGGSETDIASSIKQTSDGGYIIGAYTSSNNGDLNPGAHSEDWWIFKLDGLGNILWSKTYGGNSSETLEDIITTNDGGYLAVGQTSSDDGDVSGNNGSYDYWVLKMDESGQIVWKRCLGGAGVDIGTSIYELSDNSIVVGGLSNSGNSGDVSDPHGGFDAWVVKLSEVGAIIWQKSIGGSAGDRIFSISQLNNGTIIAAGSTESIDGDVQDNDGYVEFWIFQLNENGKLIAQKTMGGLQNDYCNDMALDLTKSGALLIGDTKSNDGDISEGFGKTDIWAVYLSLNPLTRSLDPIPNYMNGFLKTHPNPAYSTLSFDWPENAPDLSIQITDLAGKTVQNSLITPGRNLNVEDLPNGVYLLRATDNSGKISVGKFVKQ